MTSAFVGFENTVCAAVPLSTMTCFRIGGPAEHFIEPGSFEELAALVGCCVHKGIPFRVLGGGSNILASDRGVSGAVFRLSRMNALSRTGRHIICEAGAPLTRLLLRAEQWGLGGVEPLAGIPGTVGGAVVMNAGGKYGQISSVLSKVITLDRSGAFHQRTADQLGLAYRRSELQGEIVLRVDLELEEKDPVEIAETRFGVLQDKVKTQPLTSWSAGCVFKNPQGRSAGRLIDEAGLKGERVGRAVVSGRHANFIINEGGATSSDVQALIDRVRDQVRKTFGIELELEIELWN